MPEKDRTLLLLLGHANNEINVFQKLMKMVRKEPTSHLVDIVEAGQILVLMRTLVGKLHEAKLILDKRIQGDPYIRGRYHIGDDWAGTQELREVNQHFGEIGDLITKVRDNVSFHSWDKHGLVEKSFNEIPESEPWEFYLADTAANSFYYASELVTTRSAIALTKTGSTTPSTAETQNQGLAELFDATLKAARLLSKFFVTMMVEIIDKSIPDGLDVDEVEIGPAPKPSDLHLPFFLDEDDLRGRIHN